MRTDKLVIYLNTLIEDCQLRMNGCQEGEPMYHYYDGRIGAYELILWAINEEEKYNVTNADKF